MQGSLIDGLKKIREGLDIVIAHYEDGNPFVTSINFVPPQKSGSVQESKAELDYTASTVKVNKDLLNGMSFPDLRKFAVNMGLTPTGTRDEMVKQIIKKSSEEYTPPADVIIPSEPANIIVEDNIYDEICDMFDGKPDSYIADKLSSAGYPSMGKRETLIDTFARGVRDGKFKLLEDVIELSNEKDLEVGEDNKIAATSRGYGVNEINNPNMTPAREKALIMQEKEVVKQLKDKPKTIEVLKKYVDQVYGENTFTSEDDIVTMYNKAVFLLTDDNGKIAKRGTKYMLNGNPACCGVFLIEENGRYKCEKCGNTYEIE